MAVKNKILTVPMASFNSASVNGTYKPIITGGLAKGCFFLRIINASDKDVTISYDGTNDADYCFAESSINVPAVYPLIPQTNYAVIAQGTQVYIKGTAGTGTIYVAGYYQPQGV